MHPRIYAICTNMYVHGLSLSIKIMESLLVQTYIHGMYVYVCMWYGIACFQIYLLPGLSLFEGFYCG